jgi:hypothetical protein
MQDRTPHILLGYKQEGKQNIGRPKNVGRIHYNHGVGRERMI